MVGNDPVRRNSSWVEANSQAALTKYGNIQNIELTN
jgi:hypothetical protein